MLEYTSNDYHGHARLQAGKLLVPAPLLLPYIYEQYEELDPIKCGIILIYVVLIVDVIVIDVSTVSMLNRRGVLLRMRTLLLSLSLIVFYI